MDEKHTSLLTCEQVSELISEYIDGELDDATAAAVASHIDNCDDCRRLYDEISAVCRAVHNIGEVQVPDGLHERIMTTIRTQKRATRRRRTITYLGIGVAAMLCLSVMSSTLVQRMGTNADNLIIISELTDAGSGPADTALKPSESDKTTAEGLHDGRGDSEAEVTDSMHEIPEAPSHDEIDDSTAATTKVPDLTQSSGNIPDTTPRVTTHAPADTLPVPETTAEYPVEESTEKAESFTGAPADVVATESPEWTAPEETKGAPNYTMAVQTEAVQDAPSADAVQRPSAQGKPDYSLTTSAPSSSFNIFNVWTWKGADGVSHTLELRTNGTFTYTCGSKVTGGSFTFEDNVLTLRYGWLGKARYSVGVYKGNIALLHLSGRKLLG